MRISVGEKVVIEATFQLNRRITNPSLPVTVSIRPPQSSLVELTSNQQSNGVFSVEYTPSEVGRYLYVVRSDDGGVSQGSFSVRPVLTDL